MSKLLLLIVSMLILVNCFAQKPGAKFDTRHYSYRITVNDESDKINVEATIQMLMLNDTDSIILDLVTANPQGKGMTVSSVTSGENALNFTQQNNKLLIAAKKRKNEQLTLKIVYSGIPADGLIISKTKYGKRSFFADNWPDRARNWIVSVDDPADKAAVDFIIIAPSHYQVVANGVLIEETNLDASKKLTHWRESIDLPTKIMTVGIADFAVNHLDSTGNVNIQSWVYPEDREKGFYDFDLAREIIPFFEKYVAPFPYRKLANVQSKTIFGGLENAGAIFYAENLVNGKRTSEPTVAHEIAHQWFGDMATEVDFSHLWLSEGFATFMTMFYMEAKYGKDTADKLLAENRQQVIDFAAKNPKPIVDSSVKSYMELLNANSYQKGGWVLHMLRHELGDEVFWKGIQLYYKTYAGKNASTGDLQKIMESVSGKNLKQFFYQWLYVAGQPELQVSHKYQSNTGKLTIEINQLQAKPFVFPITLTIAGDNDTGSIEKTVLVNSKHFTIDIPVRFNPKNVLIDKNIRLLYKGPAISAAR